MKQTDAFTLIELIAVLVIIGLISIIIPPNIIKVYEQWQLRTFVDNFIMDIRLCRQLAISKGYRHLIELNIKDKYYYLRGDYVTEPAIKKVDLVSCIKNINTSFIITPSGYIKIIFNENGAPGGGGTIEFLTGDGRKSVVTVLPVTGRVQKK